MKEEQKKTLSPADALSSSLFFFSSLPTAAAQKKKKNMRALAGLLANNHAKLATIVFPLSIAGGFAYTTLNGTSALADARAVLAGKLSFFRHFLEQNDEERSSAHGQGPSLSSSLFQLDSASTSFCVTRPKEKTKEDREALEYR